MRHRPCKNNFKQEQEQQQQQQLQQPQQPQPQQQQPQPTTTTRYKQTLGPRSLYISLFVSTLKGTNKHWDPVVVI